MLKLNGDLKSWRTRMAVWPEPVMAKFWECVVTWAIHHDVLEDPTKHLQLWFNKDAAEVGWQLWDGTKNVLVGGYIPHGDQGVMHSWMSDRKMPEGLKHDQVDWNQVSWGSHT